MPRGLSLLRGQGKQKSSLAEQPSQIFLTQSGEIYLREIYVKEIYLKEIYAKEIYVKDIYVKEIYSKETIFKGNLWKGIFFNLFLRSRRTHREIYFWRLLE